MNFDKVKEMLNSGSISQEIIIGLAISFALGLIVMVIKSIIVSSRNYYLSSPWLYKGTKEAKKEVRIYQDPTKANSITLRRSKNEGTGIEFSYNMWLFVSGFEYKHGDWKHIMHKGSQSAIPTGDEEPGDVVKAPNKCPAIYFHKDTNAIRVYINTYNSLNEYIDVYNIPVTKWFHLAVVVKNMNVDVMINGFVKKRMVLSSIPKQNFGDVFLNAYGGFDGYMSRVRYFNYAISPGAIQKELDYGPDMNIPNTAQDRPPYLSSYWWTNIWPFS